MADLGQSLRIDPEAAMDYEERITRLEVLVETLQEQMNRLHADMDLLRKQIAELQKRTDDGFAELRSALADLRQHTDQGLAALRQHVDDGLAAERQHIDQGLAELRKEMLMYMRWQFGMHFTVISLIAGLYAKLFGLY